MLILSIESSCDDTSVALVDCSKDGFFVVAEKTASQIDVHKKYGGVVPEIAGRMHAEKIVPLIEEIIKTLKHKNIKTIKNNKTAKQVERSSVFYKRREQINPDLIAVTAGPGLITGLVVGVEAAKTLSYVWGVPLVSVNHIKGHIHSVEISKSEYQISNIQYPSLTLVVSGGHTELVLMKKEGAYKIIGKTRDDAAGECFDKVAKLLGLPYPGGPQISKLASSGNTDAIKFPRPMINSNDFDFSFSGLKTAALYWLRDNKKPIADRDFKDFKDFSTFDFPDFCASFEQAIIDVLVAKTIRAANKFNPKSIILCGGVSANNKLRETLKMKIEQQFPASKFYFPATEYCMDNAAMIAVAGYYQAQKKRFADWRSVKADPNWEI